MKKIEVSAAILLKDGKVLCAQRKENKLTYISEKFEFPGGKLELGETPKAALQRELQEEMELEVSIEDMEFLCTIEHQYPDFHIRMYCFICPIEKDDIKLKEHISIQWKTIENLMELDWAPADIPAIEAIIKRGI